MQKCKALEYYGDKHSLRTYVGQNAKFTSRTELVDRFLGVSSAPLNCQQLNHSELMQLNIAVAAENL